MRCVNEQGFSLHAEVCCAAQIIPTVPVNAHTPSADHSKAPPAAAPARLSWARLLKRVFDIDLEHCPRCGGPLKIIAAIEHRPVIAKVLAHLGLLARAPPRSLARAFHRSQLA